MCGAIYAPQHTMTMQTGNPKFYGAVVAKSITIKDSAAFHFDEALRGLRISNITAGSAAPVSADYQINITGGPAFSIERDQAGGSVDSGISKSLRSAAASIAGPWPRRAS